MDRARFEHLLAAYGADFSRWPAGERADGAAFAASQAAEIAEALAAERVLDETLKRARAPEIDTDTLAARILAAAPRPGRVSFDTRAMLALAACAVFGVVLGYGGGLLAPTPEEDGAYFAMAFEAPPEDEG